MTGKILLPLVVAGLVLSIVKLPTTTFAIPCLICTNAIPDELDDGPWPCDEQDDEDSDCDPPSANDGPGGDSNTNDPPCDCGMPTWRISQPYITVWLRDTPLLYRR